MHILKRSKKSDLRRRRGKEGRKGGDGVDHPLRGAQCPLSGLPFVRETLNPLSAAALRPAGRKACNLQSKARLTDRPDRIFGPYLDSTFLHTMQIMMPKERRLIAVSYFILFKSFHREHFFSLARDFYLNTYQRNVPYSHGAVTFIDPGLSHLSQLWIRFPTLCKMDIFYCYCREAF